MKLPSTQSSFLPTGTQSLFSKIAPPCLILGAVDDDCDNDGDVGDDNYDGDANHDYDQDYEC